MQNKLRLNKQVKKKIIRLLQNKVDEQGNICYLDDNGMPYNNLRVHHINRFLVEKHGITEETLDDFIELI